MAWKIDAQGHMTQVPDTTNAGAGEQVLNYNPFGPKEQIPDFFGVKGKPVPAPTVADVAKGYNAKGTGSTAPAAAAPATPAAPARSSSVGVTGITNGQYEDYKSMISQALKSLGFDSLAQDWMTMDPLTDTDKLNRLVGYAKSGLDMEGITNAFRNDQALVAINPGLPYGLSREDYYLQRQQMEQAFAQRFGKPGTMDAVSAKATSKEAGPAPAEADWEKAVFHERLSPTQSSQMFSSYFQNLGRAPTAEEIGKYQTRSTTQYGGSAVQPSFGAAATGPTSPGLAGPARNPRSG